jgi:hypothetical protein
VIGEIVVSELPLILYSAPGHFYDDFGDAVRFSEATYDSVHPARLLASYAGSNRSVGLVGAPSSVRAVRFGNFLDQTGFRK